MSAAANPRRAAIRALLARKEIATQEELRAQLARAGHAVTQATLSRDLAALGARRVHRATGGTAYELPGAPVIDGGADPLSALGALVVDVVHNGTLVVVRTQPGAASAIAAVLDRARLPEIIGTIAGDDTIFLAPARGHAAGRLAHVLRRRIAAPEITP